MPKNNKLQGIRITIAAAIVIIISGMILIEFRQLLSPGPTPPVGLTVTLNIRARIDGVSRLVIQGDTARWYHVLAFVPGRWIESATYLNGREWNLTWPDVPDRGNHNCECYSSIYNGLPTVANDPLVALEIIQARGEVSIFQPPDKANDYILIVEFDDVILPDKTYGDDMYDINLIAHGISIHI
jgi:hypothetical protein